MSNTEIKKITISDDNPTKTCAKCNATTKRLYYMYENVKCPNGYCIRCSENSVK